jgi:hypothetical protein
MPRIYDYNNFSSSSGSREEYEFKYKLEYVDCDIYNFSPEMKDLDTSSAVIRYKASVRIDKSGIYDIDFKISEIELTLNINDYPEDDIIEEIEIKPGINIPEDQISIIKGDNLIPSYPTNISVDMKGTNDVGKFLVEITFGADK